MTAAALKHTATQLPSINDHSVEVGNAPYAMANVADSLWRQPSPSHQKRRQSNVSHDTGYESHDDSDDAMHDDIYDPSRFESMALMS